MNDANPSPPSSRAAGNPASASHPPGAPRYEFFKVIQHYLDQAGRLAGIPEHVALILSQPKAEIIVNFPVRMDDGKFRIFKGYRIQHNNILGPYKGGMRYHQDASLDDFKALSKLLK